MLGDTIVKALEQNGSLCLQFSTLLCTGLPKTGKTSFSHMLLKQRTDNLNPGDNVMLFIKRKSLFSNKETEWEKTEMVGLVNRLNLFLKYTTKLSHIVGTNLLKPANVKEVWSVFMLLDISVPAFLTYYFPKTFFTCIIDRFNKLKKSFDHCQQKGDNLPLQHFDNLHYFKNVISASRLKESSEEINLFKEMVAFEEDKCTYIAFVGTHLDENLENPDSINSGLDDMLNDINCPDEDDPLPVLHLGDGKLIHTINIAKTSDKNVDKLFSEMNQANQVTYNIPIPWLLLVLEMKKLCSNRNQKYVTHSEVFEKIWKAKFHNFSDSHLKAALKFFDHVGVFLYFDDGSESYIFTDWNWLFEILNILLTKPITLATYAPYSLFMYEGILGEKLISKISLSLKSTLKVDLVIKLLVNLRLAAPLNRSYVPGIEYFIPYRLPVFKDDKFLTTHYGNIEYEPLLITFLAGTLHPSLFCLLAAYFMENLPCGWKMPQKSKESKRYTFNNLITFPNDSGCSVTMYDKTYWLEIQIRNMNSKTPYSAFPYQVFSSIESALIGICKQLNRNINEVKYGFQCKICGNNANKHIMVAHKKPEDQFPLGQCCKRRYARKYLEDSCYTTWFVKVCLYMYA